jgi:RNA recognition motif-containing protein
MTVTVFAVPCMPVELPDSSDVCPCRIVMDKTTGQPKGTAFVEYRYPDGAANASTHGQ